jgi:hypothetical protein
MVACFTKGANVLLLGHLDVKKNALLLISERDIEVLVTVLPTGQLKVSMTRVSLN